MQDFLNVWKLDARASRIIPIQTML